MKRIKRLLILAGALATAGCARSDIKAWSNADELFHVESSKEMFSPGANVAQDLQGSASRTITYPDGRVEVSTVQFGRATTANQDNHVPLAEIASKTLLGALAGGAATGNPAGVGIGAAAGAAIGAAQEITHKPPAPSVEIDDKHNK